jgi:hypothetical protein
MIQHKVKVVSTSMTELIRLAFEYAAVGSVDNASINAIAMPYSFTVDVKGKELLAQDAGKVRPVKSKELEEFLNKHDLDKLRVIAMSYGVALDATRADIIKAVKRVAI